MSKLSEQQLLAAKQGDERALAGVISHMMPQIRFGVSGLAGCGLEEEDLVQEGLIGLMRAVAHYDLKQTASFETYASSCIRNAQVTALRSAGRKKHFPLNSSVPLDENEETVPGPEELTIQQEDMRIWQERFRSQLSERERQVLTCFMQGSSMKETAVLLNCTPKAAETALARARRKLRVFL